MAVILPQAATGTPDAALHRRRTALAEPLHAPCSVEIWPHPLTAEGRTTIMLPPGTPLDTLAAAALPGLGPGLILVSVDGRAVPPSARARTRLRAGQHVALRPALAGGGDSNPLQIIGTIALLALGAWLPGASFLAGLTSFQASLVSAGIMVAGGLVLNALIPPPDPAGAAAGPEPVYSLTGGANRARPYAPVPLILGAHRIFPDLAAAPWARFDNDNNQDLVQVFGLGVGAPEISDTRIENTPLDSFENVSRHILRGRAGPERADIHTEAGPALDNTDWQTRRTAEKSTHVAIDLAARQTAYNDKGEGSGRTVTLDLEARPADTSDPWTRLGPGTLSLAGDERASEVRRSTVIRLPSPGTWDVRIRRTAAPADGNRDVDILQWTALRSIRPDTGDYRGQTRLWLRIRASGQFSGSTPRLSCMARQPVPVPDGQGGWQTKPNSNPAWIFLWLAKGLRVDGRLIAGAGLPDARINLDAIRAWAAFCTRHGLRCDAVISSAMVARDLLTMVARCGRATPTWASGRLGVIYDDPDTPVSSLITPGNIIPGSLRIAWASGAAAEEIALRYIDKDRDWTWQTVRRLMPGLTGPPASTTTVTFPGITDTARAEEECALQAARQIYHRRRISWDMGLEGLAIARGDVVALSHGLLDGGIAGRATANPQRTVLSIDRAVEIDDGDRILIRSSDGSIHDSAVGRHPGDAATGPVDRLKLAKPLPQPLDADGADPADTLWRLHSATEPYAHLRIIGTEPRGEDRIRLTAIDEVDAYYQRRRYRNARPNRVTNPRSDRGRRCAGATSSTR